MAIMAAFLGVLTAGFMLYLQEERECNLEDLVLRRTAAASKAAKTLQRVYRKRKRLGQLNLEPAEKPPAMKVGALNVTEGRTVFGRQLQILYSVTLVLNVCGVVLFSMPDMDCKRDGATFNDGAKIFFLRYEVVCNIIFLHQVIVYLIACPQRFFRSFWRAFDILCIIPGVAMIAINWDLVREGVCEPEAMVGIASRLLGVLMFRAIRILNFPYFRREVTMVLRALGDSAPNLVVPAFLAMQCWLVCACLFMLLENLDRPGSPVWEEFRSIPESMYWTSIFLVGEWALADFSYMGSRLCILLVLFCIAIFALPVGIIVEAMQSTMKMTASEEADLTDLMQRLGQDYDAVVEVVEETEVLNKFRTSRMSKGSMMLGGGATFMSASQRKSVFTSRRPMSFVNVACRSRGTMQTNIRQNSFDSAPPRATGVSGVTNVTGFSAVGLPRGSSGGFRGGFVRNRTILRERTAVSARNPARTQRTQVPGQGGNGLLQPTEQRLYAGGTAPKRQQKPPKPRTGTPDSSPGPQSEQPELTRIKSDSAPAVTGQPFLSSIFGTWDIDRKRKAFDGFKLWLTLGKDPVPLQLQAHMEAGSLVVTCTTLSGETLAQYVGLDPEQTGQDLATRVFREVAPPVKKTTEWKPTLPSGRALEGERLLLPLRELFEEEAELQHRQGSQSTLPSRAAGRTAEDLSPGGAAPRSRSALSVESASALDGTLRREEEVGGGHRGRPRLFAHLGARIQRMSPDERLLRRAFQVLKEPLRSRPRGGHLSVAPKGSAGEGEENYMTTRISWDLGYDLEDDFSWGAADSSLATGRIPQRAASWAFEYNANWPDLLLDAGADVRLLQKGFKALKQAAKNRKGGRRPYIANPAHGGSKMAAAMGAMVGPTSSLGNSFTRDRGPPMGPTLSSGSGSHTPRGRGR